MTPEELAAKIEWEGGVFSVLEYGLKATDLDDSNAELKRAWVALCDAYDDFETYYEAFDRLLPEEF